MEGDELARQIRTLDPDLRVLYLTSHADRLFDTKPQLWAEVKCTGNIGERLV